MLLENQQSAGCRYIESTSRKSDLSKPLISCHDLILTNLVFIVGMSEIYERPASPVLMERGGIGVRCTQLLGRAAPYYTPEPNAKAH